MSLYCLWHCAYKPTFKYIFKEKFLQVCHVSHIIYHYLQYLYECKYIDIIYAGKSIRTRFSAKFLAYSKIF